MSDINGLQLWAALSAVVADPPWDFRAAHFESHCNPIFIGVERQSLYQSTALVRRKPLLSNTADSRAALLSKVIHPSSHCMPWSLNKWRVCTIWRCRYFHVSVILIGNANYFLCSRLSFTIPSTKLLTLTTLISGYPIAAASSSSNFQLIFNNALIAYEKRTKKDPLSHPLATELRDCDNIQANSLSPLPAGTGTWLFAEWRWPMEKVARPYCERPLYVIWGPWRGHQPGKPQNMICLRSAVSRLLDRYFHLQRWYL